MTLDEARDLLDSARAGWDISPARITQALRITGDIEDVDLVQLLVSAGDWERCYEEHYSQRMARPFDGLLS